MSFWKLLADAGLVAGAPFTGGATLAFIPAANSMIDNAKGDQGGNAVANASSILGAQQAGKAKGALDQAGAQQSQDRNAISLYQAQQAAQNAAAQTDLERQQFATNNRGDTAKQALVGALLGGGYKATVPGAAISSGLLKSLNSNPDALAAMQTLGKQGSTAQNTPLSFTGGDLVKPPALTPLPDLGSLNSTLSNIANIGQIGGAVTPSFLKILQQLRQNSSGGIGTQPFGPGDVYGSSNPDDGMGGGF